MARSRLPRSSMRPSWTYVLLLAVLSYVAGLLGTEAPIDLRVGLLRYWTLFSGAALAMAVPHVLLPDPRVPLLQLLNRSPVQLLTYQLGQWAPVITLVALPAVVLVFYDPGRWAMDLSTKGVMLIEHLLIIVGTGVYSVMHYGTLGARSQAWQEGRAGQWYATAVETAGQGVSVPRGLVPALFATGRVFSVALAAVIAAAYLEPIAAGLAAWAPGAAVCLAAGWRGQRAGATYDRHFYQTNAFYREVLGGGGLRAQAREPIAYAAIYWAPHRWRPAVWASIRQFDRVLPLGRLVALGHGLLWLLFWQGGASTVVAAYLLLFIVAQNAACYVLTRPRLAPPAFQISQASPTYWVLVRFFVNLRWTLPFALSLGLVAWLDPTFGGADAAFWIGVDVALALGAAALVTALHELTVRRRFA